MITAAAIVVGRLAIRFTITGPTPLLRLALPSLALLVERQGQGDQIADRVGLAVG